MYQEERWYGPIYQEIEQEVFELSDGTQEIIYTLCRKTDNLDEKFLYFLSNRSDLTRQKGKSNWVKVYRRRIAQEAKNRIRYEIKRQHGRHTVWGQIRNMYWRGVKVTGFRVLLVKKSLKMGINS